MRQSTYVRVDAAETIHRIVRSAYCATWLLPWRPAPNEKPGSWIKTVVNDQAAGLGVDIRRPDPGLRQASHGHPNSFEQLYVIGGDFVDHRHEMRAGDFVYRRPGVPHGSTTRLGAEVLVVFNEADRLDTVGQDAARQHEIHVLAGANPPAGCAAPLWQEIAETSGVLRRDLYADANCAMRGSVLRFRDGRGSCQVGSEREFTQLLVISGSVLDGDHEMLAGDYACHAPGVYKQLHSIQGTELLMLHFRNRPD